MTQSAGGFLDARRATLAAATDARAASTRERLAAALRSILERGDDPSVAAVCREAGIGRSTFYTHFESVDELGLRAISRLFEEQTAADRGRRTTHVVSRAEATRIGLRGLLVAIAGARPLVRGVLRLGAGSMADRLVLEVSRTMESPILAERPGLDAESLAIASRYVAGGVVAAVELWLHDEDPDVDRLTEQLLDLLPPFLTTD